MNMVAAARLRTTQARMENFAPYARKFSEVLGNLAGRIESEVHPLLVQKGEGLEGGAASLHGGQRSLRQLQRELHQQGGEVDQGAEDYRQRTRSDPGGKKGERLLQKGETQYPARASQAFTEPSTFPLSTR